MKELSIIIATYNAASTIRRCLTSIVSQKKPAVEILLIDGGSDDDTMAIVRSFGEAIDYTISEKDHGIYDAWNKGIRQASGQWLQFIGADDILFDGAILAQLDRLQANDTSDLDIITSKALMTNGTGKVIKDLSAPYCYESFIYRMDFAHGTTLHNRRLFEEQGLFDTRFRICGDYELLLRRPLKSAFIDAYMLQISYGGVSTTLAARKEPFYARKKHRALPLWKNVLLSGREIIGFIVGHYILGH
ncbi:MAG: glycosyltransferase [Prevotella sp.]|nr:glycosyltransferase [Prevotella sp.]